MAEWGATTNTTDFNATTFAQSQTEQRSSQRSGANIGTGFGVHTEGGINIGPWNIGGHQVGSSAQSLSNYSVVGINVNKIPDMREKIREEVKSIQSYIDGIDAEAAHTSAFQSEEIATSVKNYVLMVKDYCKALISDLLAFSDKLQAVSDAWTNSSTTFASDSIDSTTTAGASTFTEYSETR